MISSENALIFSYAMWLIGRVDYGVPVAAVVRTAFGRLSDQQYAPVYPSPGVLPVATAPVRLPTRCG